MFKYKTSKTRFMKISLLKSSILFWMFLTVIISVEAQISNNPEKMSKNELIAKGYRQLFNGTDLSGWDGPAGSWRIEDGALTWESTAENPLKDWPYLIWKGGQPENFDLLVDFLLSAQANSGVDFRSKKIDDKWSLGGYQADITGDGRLTGTIYRDHPLRTRILRGQSGVESSGGELKITTFGDDAKLLAATFHPGKWNTIRVVCQGPKISYYLNGVLISELTDNGPDFSGKGFIGFQMHQGPPMKVQYKNIYLKEF
jgi:hypothetical protein